MTIRNGIFAYRRPSYKQSLLPSAPIEGGAITGTGDYRAHVFTTSQTFKVREPVDVEVLLVGGGGGGGMDNGGGGGAGEVIYSRKHTLSVGEYVVSVGAGGAGAPTSAGSSTGNPASDGSPSVISNVATAIGGGGGASGQGTVESRKGGRPGGSSGGGQGENFNIYFIYPGLSYPFYDDYEVPYVFSGAWGTEVSVAGGSELDFGTSVDFTIECWVLFSNLTNNISSSGSIFRTSNASTFYRLAFTAQGVLHSSTSFQVSTGGTLQTVFSVGGLTEDAWHHVAVTRSGDTFRLYIDGKRMSTTVNSNINMNSAGGNFIIGSGWEGNIKDVRVVRGQALYTAETITIPTSSLEAITGTVLLAIKQAEPVDSSSYNRTVTLNDSVTSTAHTDEAMTRYRGSPHSYDHNLVSYNRGIVSRSGGYLRADGALTAINTADTPWTMECWINPQSAGSGVDNYIFGINTTSGGNVYLLGQSQYFDGTGIGYSTIVNPTGDWYHFAVASDGTRVRTFVNGVLQVDDARLGTVLAGNTFAIGTEFDTSSLTPGNYTFGRWRNIRVVAGTALYTANFTPPDLNTNLEAVPGTTLLTGIGSELKDYSPANTPITVVGSIAAVEGMPIYTTYSCRSFDSGFSGYYRADAALDTLTSLTSPWTIEAFVQSDSNFYGGDDARTIFGINAAVGGANVYWLEGFRLVWDNGTTDQYYTIADRRQRLTKKWTHVAYTFDGSVLRTFFDGVLRYSGVHPPRVPLADCVFGIGAEFDAGNGGSAGNYFVGKMRDLRVTARCLYTSDFTSPNPITDTLAPVADTTLLLFKNGSIIDESGNNTTVTTHAGGARLSNSLAYSYRLRQYNQNYMRYGSPGGAATASDGGGGAGGGAYGHGGDGGADTGGIGGAGAQLGIINPLAYWAGGGGGGNSNSGSTAVRAGGAGGGGAGGVTGVAGAANTGGGGGASRINIAGAAGGSGIAIIRYRLLQNEN